MPSTKVCEKLKKKDKQICELRYGKFLHKDMCPKSLNCILLCRETNWFEERGPQETQSPRFEENPERLGRRLRRLLRKGRFHQTDRRIKAEIHARGVVKEFLHLHKKTSDTFFLPSNCDPLWKELWMKFWVCAHGKSSEKIKSQTVLFIFVSRSLREKGFAKIFWCLVTSWRSAPAGTTSRAEKRSSSVLGVCLHSDVDIISRWMRYRHRHTGVLIKFLSIFHPTFGK